VLPVEIQELARRNYVLLKTTRRIRRFISSLFAQGVSGVFEWGCIIERSVYLLRRVFSGSG